MITGLFLGILLFALITIPRCFFNVEQGHVAMLSTFGALARKPGGVLVTHGPGLHSKRPWQQVHKVSMMEQSIDLSGEVGGRTAMASDGTILRFDSILRFTPIEDQLEAFLFGLRAPIEHMTGLFTCLLRNEIANFSGAGNGVSDETAIVVRERDGELAESASSQGSYALIRRERRQLNERLEAFCRERVGERNGVRFDAVDLTDILPPDELAAALNAVMNARTEAETRYARAEGESQQRVLSSEKGVEIATARAHAAEVEILELARFLTLLDASQTLDLYVSRRRAEVLGEARTTYLKGAVG